MLLTNTWQLRVLPRLKRILLALSINEAAIISVEEDYMTWSENAKDVESRGSPLDPVVFYCRQESIRCRL